MNFLSRNFFIRNVPVLLFCLFLMLTMIAFAAKSADASVGVGYYPNMYPYNCYFQGMPLYAPIHFGTGPTLGWLKLERSTYCGTSWVHFASADSSRWDIYASIWHPGKPSYEERNIWNGWMDTKMLDVTPGVQNCMGAQVYVHNSIWIGWFFGGCWTP